MFKNLNDFICPNCKKKKLEILNPEIEKKNIKNASIICKSCLKKYIVRNFIPRFISNNNYSSNFGYEWLSHQTSQVDSKNGTNISETRLFSVTKWNKNLKGEDILEAGSGSGRFTEHLIKTKANIYSFDISQAVEANFNNNKSNQNLKLFQADIYNIPLDKKFDKILCFGVLQHCPDVKKSFLNLTKYLKPGGEIVVDFYYRSWKRFYSPMFYLRFLTCRIKPSLLYKIIKFYVKFTWPLTRLLNKIPFIGPRIIFLMCIIDHTNKDIDYKGQKIKNDKLLKDWAILNTFDLLSARYENNQKKSEVRKMAQEAKLKNIKIFYGPNGICLRGQKQ